MLHYGFLRKHGGHCCPLTKFLPQITADTSGLQNTPDITENDVESIKRRHIEVTANTGVLLQQKSRQNSVRLKVLYGNTSNNGDRFCNLTKNHSRHRCILQVFHENTADNSGRFWNFNTNYGRRRCPIIKLHKWQMSSLNSATNHARHMSTYENIKINTADTVVRFHFSHKSWRTTKTTIAARL